LWQAFASGQLPNTGSSGWSLRSRRRASRLGELMGDPEKSKRVTNAMLKMQKIIVADLQKAYDG